MALDKPIDERIVEFVQENWEAQQKATKLNWLGAKLKDEYDLAAALAGAKLKNYLQDRLGDRLHVLCNPRDSLEWGAVPITIDVGGEERQLQLFGKQVKQNEISGTLKNARSYDRMLWAAFSVPLDSGYKRIVSVGSRVEFKSIPVADTIPEGWHEIPAELIVPVGPDQPPNRSTRLATNIDSWVAERGINPSVAKSEHRPSRTSLLHHLLDAMDERSLAETQMSLRAIRNLLGKHV